VGWANIGTFDEEDDWLFVIANQYPTVPAMWAAITIAIAVRCQLDDLTAVTLLDCSGCDLSSCIKSETANLLLQLGYQSQQLLPTQRDSIFSQRHGLKYKLPPLKPQAGVTNQILLLHQLQPGLLISLPEQSLLGLDELSLALADTLSSVRIAS
jgi:hypothetical protein